MRLCRTFGCLPSQLEAEDPEIVRMATIHEALRSAPDPTEG